jgi:protein-disulfide isomerase
MRKSLLFFLLGVSLLPGWSCRPTNESEKLAEVDGSVVTRAEFDRSAGTEVRNLRQRLYQLERQKLDEYIGATLLTQEAKERGVSVSTLLEQEVNNKVQPVTEDEIQSFYEKNKGRLRVELGKVQDQIRDYLREQKTAERKSEYFKMLRANAKITTYLKAPPIYRAEVSTNGAPSKGAGNAPVKIVKFEDFECPFCKTVQPTLTELLKKYDGKVRLVHKDLPLEAIHPQATLAAEAARCAGDQGKFWQYHDTLYAKVPKLGPTDLKVYAKEIGLDTASFDECLESGKHKNIVQKDLAEGAKLGLTGTPSFFINGREISGAQQLEAFSAIIDEELARAN